jgi:hypothetical protein
MMIDNQNEKALLRELLEAAVGVVCIAAVGYWMIYFAAILTH